MLKPVGYNAHKVKPESYPREGLVLEFENQTSLIFYIGVFFGPYYEGFTSIFIEKLIRLDIIKEIVKYNGNGSISKSHFSLDCQKILVYLGFVSPIKEEDNLEYYTIQDVAKKLSVTRQTIYNLIAKGFLEPVVLNGVKGQRISKRVFKNYVGEK